MPLGGLKAADERDTLEHRWRLHEHYSLLILDELGYLGINKQEADLMFQLANKRYKSRRSTIATTNAGIERWTNVFYDGVTSSAIADRLCHHCTVVRITGRSYRLKNLNPDDFSERRRGGD